MNSIEFGKLLAALRKQNYNQFGKKWTREELSRHIHVSSHQLGRLERGSRKYLDTETLHLLADTFNLTTLERKDLFYAAVGISEEKLVNPEDTNSEAIIGELLSILKTIQVPSFIVDDYANIVAANNIIIKLYNVNQEYLNEAAENGTGFNLLKFIYEPLSGYKDSVNSAWEKMAIKNIYFFRRITMKHRHKDKFKEILKELRKIREFDIHWYQASKNPILFDSVYDDFCWNHSDYGPIHYISTESTIPTEKGNLYLVNYNPANIKTSTVWIKIAGEVGAGLRRLTPWPDRNSIAGNPG